MPVDISTALAESLRTVTKDWTAAKRHTDRQNRVSQRELERLRRAHAERALNIKEAAYQVMPEAYQKASANGRLPANARQVMYAARPEVLRLTGGKCWKNDSYFTQKLLPDFMAARPDLTAAWDVVFDDRGHLIEPYTGERLGIGTLAVRQYIGRWSRGRLPGSLSAADLLAKRVRIPTVGPHLRYGAVLFVEKEGFDALWEAVNLADRYDLAIMSTKGMSVTAARALVEELSAAEIPVYVLHDFDKAGFSIVHTLRTDTRRYTFRRAPQVVDLGLRLSDVEAMGLQSEPVEYESDVDPRINLRGSGATEAEARFLVHGTDRWSGHWVGQRVELNAMTSDQLVAWLENRLEAAGVRKVIPDAATLEATYRRARALAQVERAIQAVLNAQHADTAPVPGDLAAQIAETIDGTTDSWDTAIWDMVREASDEAAETD